MTPAHSIEVARIAHFLEELAPAALAESWDNVGLLIGRPEAVVRRLMTCLTITPASVREAIDGGAELIVSHHPLPFRPLKRLTSETPEGRLLLELMAARVSVFSAHTAFDSALRGINQRLAEGLELCDVRPLVPSEDAAAGGGRIGRYATPTTLAALVTRVKKLLAIKQVQVVGPGDRRVASVAIACGSAGEFLGPAAAAGCDVLLTGEVRFHTALEAEALDVGMVLTGHFASERFAVEALATVLGEQFGGLQVWASQQETDPLQWF